MLKGCILIICSLSLILISSINVDSKEIIVDASNEIGPIPEIFSSSIWLTYLDEKDEYIIKKFLRENYPSTIQFTISKILRESEDFEDFKRGLHKYLISTPVSFLIDAVRERGIRLIVGYDPRGMPQWLSSRPEIKGSISRGNRISIMNVSPPRDYNLWGKVAGYTVNLLFNEMKVHNLGFYVGHEPNDRDWAGTEESFFKYYGIAAKAVKEVDKRILIGGIGVWSVNARKSKCDKYPDTTRRICEQEDWAGKSKTPMLYNFLRYVGKNSIPLDFINWHSFRAVPINFRKKQVSTLLEWIRDSGLDSDKISLYPSDWTYWSMRAGGYPADYLDTEENAAYIINALYNMWVAGITSSGHDFNVRNPSKERRVIKKRDRATFIGDWPLFTRDGIIKASYNAFRAISMLSGPEKASVKMLNVLQPSDRRISTISVIDKDSKEIRTIIANFSPSDIRMFHLYLKGMLKEEGYLKPYNALTELERCINRKQGKQKMKLLDLCAEEIPADKRSALKSVIDGYKCLLSKNPKRCITEHGARYNSNEMPARLYRYISDNILEREITLRYVNLPYDGRISVNIYRIDKDNANPCRLNKSTEPKTTNTPCGINGLIDRRIKKARVESIEKTVRRHLLRSGYNSKMSERIISDIRKCPSGRGKACLKKIKERYKIRANVKEMMKRYYSEYFRRIEDINSIKGVSLKGSLEMIHKSVKERKFLMNLWIKPNTVLLIVIKKA
jgi:hypothetical protein